MAAAITSTSVLTGPSAIYNLSFDRTEDSDATAAYTPESQ